MAATWIKANDASLSQSAKGDLAALMLAAARSGDADAAGLMGDMEQTLLAVSNSGELPLWQHGNVVDAWLAVGDKAKAQQWAMRGYQFAVGTEAARATVVPWDLELLSMILKRAGLTGEGKGYAQCKCVGWHAMLPSYRVYLW